MKLIQKSQPKYHQFVSTSTLNEAFQTLNNKSQ